MKKLKKLNMKKQSIRNHKLNLVKDSVLLTQLSSLTFFAIINPATAESIKNNSQITEAKFIRDTFSRYKVSSSAKDLVLILKDISAGVPQGDTASPKGFSRMVSFRTSFKKR